jgi:4-fold beta flower protein
LEWLWTWGGACFGYREGDDLYTYDGRHVGHFVEKVVYGRNGLYLGEIRGRNRLVRKRANASWKQPSFNPRPRRPGQPRYVAYSGYPLDVGDDDFPPPESFHD